MGYPNAIVERCVSKSVLVVCSLSLDRHLSYYFPKVDHQEFKGGEEGARCHEMYRNTIGTAVCVLFLILFILF